MALPNAKEHAVKTRIIQDGPEPAVAVMMVLGRYLVHALIVNSLGLAPPVPSIFEDGFE